MTSSHVFSNPVLAYAKYYIGFMDDKGFEIMFKQLPFKLSEVNAALDEVTPFADSVRTSDKSKSTKLETAIPKLYRYVKKLLNCEVNPARGVSEFSFLMDAGDLKRVPGHAPRVLAASTDMLVNMVAAMSTAVTSISKPTSPNQTANPVKVSKPDPVPGPSNTTTSSAKAPKRDKKQQSKTKESEWKVVKPKKKSKQQRKEVKTKISSKPKPTIPAVLKDFRLYIGAGDLDVSERHIRNWAKSWKVHEGDLKVTKITKKSYVCEFKSRSRNFTAPAGVRCEKFKKTGPIIPLSERRVATKLYVTTPECVSDEDVLQEIYPSFTNIDTSLSEIRPLPRGKADNCGNYCYEKRFWVKLVSERNGEEPICLGGLTPFTIKPWLNWRRQPRKPLPAPANDLSGKESTSSPDAKSSSKGLLKSASKSSMFARSFLGN